MDRQVGGSSVVGKPFLWTLLTLSSAFSCTVAPPELGLASRRSRDVGQEAVRLQRKGMHDVAARRFQESARRASMEGNLPGQLEFQIAAAENWLQAGQPSLARTAYARAANLLQRIPSSHLSQRSGTLRVATGFGDLELLAGRASNAKLQYEEALPHALGRARDTVLLRLSLTAQALGNSDQARRYRQQIRNPSSHELTQLTRALSPTSAPAPLKVVEVKPTPDPSSPSALLASAASPSILGRNRWQARRTKSNVTPMGRIWRITVHHTAQYASRNSSQSVADQIHRVQRHHMSSKGWADIGYHFLIDANGRIWEGRQLTHQGAHAGSPDLNRGNIGVALIGDFTAQQPTREHRLSLLQLLGHLSNRYRITANHVYTHQEIRPGPTECPGREVQHIVEQFRHRERLSRATPASVREPRALRAGP
jgi:hypothetical protein